MSGAKPKTEEFPQLRKFPSARDRNRGFVLVRLILSITCRGMCVPAGCNTRQGPRYVSKPVVKGPLWERTFLQEQVDRRAGDQRLQ